MGERDEMRTFNDVVNAMGNRVGRIIFNVIPTGAEVCPAMVHVRLIRLILITD